VRYMVQNSLGRLWKLNKPNSKLKLDYFVPTEENEDFLKISSPEELKICDPACGSGHILLYAFDILYEIYKEEGYDAKDIPQLILEKNLYGIELDERAGELAAFALVMKARDKYRRFFRKPIQPNICVLENVVFQKDELKSYLDNFGIELFCPLTISTLRAFEDADNFGSLIRPENINAEGKINELKKLRASFEKISNKDQLREVLTKNKIFDKIILALTQAKFLQAKYHCVIANPPYMGGKGMNTNLAKFAKKEYQDSKADLFAMFMERSLNLLVPAGYMGMVNMQSWMFLSSFEKLRVKLLAEKTILSMAHLGARGFDSIGGEVVQTTTFVIQNQVSQDFKGSYLRLIEGKSEKVKQADFKQGIQNRDSGYFFTSCADDFKKIPGSPIAYWVSEKVGKMFSANSALSELAPACIGMMTTDNDKFLRKWWETSLSAISFNSTSIQNSVNSGLKWFPYNKGGSYRKWAGNAEYVVNWENEGQAIKDNGMTSFRGKNYYFLEGLTWSDVTSGNLSCRRRPAGFIHDIAGHSVFTDDYYLRSNILAMMNTSFCKDVAVILNPTVHFQVGDYSKLPYPQKYFSQKISKMSSQAVSISELDWDSYEISWDFESLPLLSSEDTKLKKTYRTIRANWQSITEEMKCLEEKNNQTFIDTYNLGIEFDFEVPLKEITLTCNPVYRYGDKKSNEELEALLLADTMKEFISYAVGCMFGRYSLDKPGLILANQGNTIKDYIQKVDLTGEALQFAPDDDNVIPILEDGWFEDDIAERFKIFLKVTFGKEKYEENLSFLEDAIGKNIRKYFLKDFYTDHNKMYKKRPIYWMFSSPKGSFNALIYMHRYRPDTVSVILNDYLREYRTKLEARLDHLVQVGISSSASQGEKSKALKTQEKIKKELSELEDYERDILYPLASEQLTIDLDDGVKVNYNKFGKALKKITGLSGK